MDYSIDGDDEDTNKSNNTSDKASYIGKEEALAIALAHSKVDKNQATELKVDFDYDDNKAVYEIDFETNNAEYEYKIDAKTGAVLEYDREDKKATSSNNTASSKTTTSTKYIGKNKAKEIALNHAGLNESAIKEYEAELDKDDYEVVYEIEFKTSEAEYEYEVDAFTGEVLRTESEERDKNKKNDKSPRPTKQPTSYLSEAIIKEIVFQHAGVDATKVKGLEIELDDDDDDDDRAIYEIDFKVGKFEYEYKVDAITGDILKSKVETDD
ncbi:MAG: hypothetical protein GX271_00960 [Clostridiales bacterium]|nr:hypothetical protein [Clostridiales bacterium]